MNLASPIPAPAISAKTDAELLASASGKDRAAFDELVRRYIDFVYSVATRLTRDRHAAEDIAQAVFLVLAKKAGKIRGPALGTWLHHTTCYAAANARRIALRRTRRERAAARPEIAMPDTTNEFEPLLAILDEAIGSLGHKDRQVVIDRYLRGLDSTAIAQSLGASPAAVQKRLERAVAKLRAYFVRRGGTDAMGVAITPAVVVALLNAAAPSPATAAPMKLVVALASSRVDPSVITIVKALLSMLNFAKTASIVAISVTAVAVCGLSVVALRKSDHINSSPSTPVPVDTTIPLVTGNSVMSPIGAVGQLRSGVTVALVGVSFNPPKRKSWWRADGSPLSVAPLAQGGGDISDVLPGDVAREFAFAWHFPQVSTDLNICIAAVGSNGNMYGGGMDWVGRMLPNISADAEELPDRPATVRFYLASGPWKTEFQSSVNNGNVLNLSPALGIRLADVGDNNMVVEITQPIEQKIQAELRMIVVDAAGIEHPGNYAHNDVEPNNAMTRLHEVYKFLGVPLNHARMVRYESRPYNQWVEFRNVSLHAGQTTAVSIATSDDSPNAISH